MAAARGGHLDTLELLRSAKRSTSELPEGLQQSMLYEAVDHNREALVRMLLIQGAEVNVLYQERRYGFLLAIAAAKGHARIVSLLLEYRADINVCTRHKTPVGLAALNGYQEVVQILLGYGASYADAFELAVSGCQVHLLRFLLQEVMNSHIPASTQWKIFREAMDAAISYRNPTIISMLVESGIPIDVPAGSRHVYMAEDHAPWLSDFVISLGVDLRARLIGRSYGKERSRLSIKEDVLIAKRTWEWVGKY